MPPGMRDVAKYAKVSLSTVSAVINGQGNKYVSPEKRQDVLDAVEALGYQLPPKTQRVKKTIAVILPTLTSSFFPNLLNGIENMVTAKEHMLVYCSSQFDFEQEMNHIKTIKRQALCGVIIDSVCPTEQEEKYFALLQKEFVEQGVSVVFLERKIEHDSFYCVFVDYYQNAYLATRHLISLGHRKIAHIAGRNLNKASNYRTKGYIHALQDHKLDFDPDLICEGDFTPNSGYLAMSSLLQRRSDFTALFSANDQMAIGAIKAIHYAGKSIPEDIAVVGFDNISLSSMITPSLTTIHVPTYEMGQIAAKIILDDFEGKNNTRLFQPNINLIVRKSTDPYATNEWNLFGW